MRGLIIGMAIGLMTGLAIQSVRYASLRKAHRQLQGNVAELQRGLAERSDAGAPGAQAGMTEEERLELLRLRNQAAQLRMATNELQQLRAQVGQAGAPTGGTANTAPTPGVGELVPQERWSFAGDATPAAALQSVFFAMRQGDAKAFLELVSDQAAREFEGKTPEEMTAKLRRDAARITGYRILENDELSVEESVLVIYLAGENKQLLPMRMKKVGDQWKFAGVSTDRK
jgi:hypothetical protein